MGSKNEKSGPFVGAASDCASLELADAAGGVVAGAIITPGDAAHDDAGALILRVDEASAADVDTRVREARLIGVREEDKIAGLQILFRDILPGRCLLPDRVR